MIKVLGVKRIFVLVFLLALNVAFAAGLFLYVVPTNDVREKEYKTLRTKITARQSDINRMQIEFEQLEQQQARFEELRKQGFFSSQGRRQAEVIFKEIQNKSGVINASAIVKAGQVVADEEASKAEHTILVSPVEVKIEAVDDSDVYRYLYLIEKYFPGHMTVKSLKIKRDMDVSGAVLRGIASGANPKLVSADIMMDWRTMIPVSEVIAPQEN